MEDKRSPSSSIERAFAPEDEEDQLDRDQTSNVEHETDPERVLATPGDELETPAFPEPSFIEPDRAQSRKAETGLAVANRERNLSDNLPNVRYRDVEFHEFTANLSCLASSFVEAFESLENYIKQSGHCFINALFIIHKKDKRYMIDKIKQLKESDKKTKYTYVVQNPLDSPVLLSGNLAQKDAYNAVFKDQPKYVCIFCCYHTISLIEPLLHPGCVPWKDVSNTIVCSHASHTASLKLIETRTLQDFAGMISRDKVVFVFDGDNVGNHFKTYISRNPKKTFVICNKTSYDNQIQKLVQNNNNQDNNVVPLISNSLENAADCDIIKFVCWFVNFCEHQNRKIDITIVSKDKIFEKLLKGRHSELLIPKKRKSVIKILPELPKLPE